MVERPTHNAHPSTFTSTHPQRFMTRRAPATPSASPPSTGAHSLFDHITLDSQRHEPLWRQLFLQINALLESGALSSGMSLPAERDMARTLGVSRVTVKRCYDEMRAQGMLMGRGRGGSVIQQVPTSNGMPPALVRLKGFTEEMQELGKVASTDLQWLEVKRSSQIADIFNRPADTPFLHVVRVRKADGVPMTREQAWYDLTIAPGLSEWTGEGSAYAWLRERCGVTLSLAEQTVEAVFSTEAEMQAFSYETPQPCLLFKRRTYAAHAASLQLVEYVEGMFRGDAYIYRTQLMV